MAESTLALKLADYESDVGGFLGYGRGANAGETAWTTAQQNNITACVKSGLRRFYFPDIAPGATASYSWTFLKPTATVNVASGSIAVQMPDDFGGLDGPMTISQDDNAFPYPLKIVGIGQLDLAYASTPSCSGRPLVAALDQLKGTTAATGQRTQLKVYPTPDADYVLRCQYTILPNYLTVANPYCYGGEQHGETIREACLSAAEKDLDDAASVHEAAFQRALAKSISIDRRFQPQSIGYNGDRSDCRHRDGLGGVLWNEWNVRVGVNGVY